MVTLKTFVIIFKGISIFRNGLTSKYACLTPQFLKQHIFGVFFGLFYEMKKNIAYAYMMNYLHNLK